MRYADDVAAKAAELRPAKILLSVLAVPFWLLGLLIGILWVVVAWSIAAVQVGISDARQAGRRGEVTDGAG